MRSSFVVLAITLLFSVHCGAGAPPRPSAVATSPKADAPAVTPAPATPKPLDLSNPEAFTRTVAARIPERVLGASVTVTEPLTLKVKVERGDVLEVSLDRIWQFCKQPNTSSGCEGEVTSLERALRDSGKKEETKADNLVATVRSSEYVESIRQRTTSFVAEPLAGDLVVVYMVDVGSRARVAVEGDFAELGLDRGVAMKRARDNTARGLGPLTSRVQRGDDPFRCLVRGQYYESSALLETDAWARLAKTELPALVSVPAVDALCYAWKSDEATVARFRKTTETLFKAAPRPLSATVLRWTSAGWRTVP